jgi:UDP-glucose 4-epimerase
MNYLVTGGCGFIGSHLAEELLRRGHGVHVLDDLSTGTLRNVAYLQGLPRFQCTIDSVTNVPVVSELIDACDVVYHLAAAVGVKLIVESPVRTIETNVLGTEIVLSLAARTGKRVFLASTSEVYGKSDRIPFGEEDDLVLGPTTKGRWSYACSKAIDEFLAIAYWREKGVPTVIGRLFNTVGPRQTGRYGMVVPTFVRQGLAGSPITVFGDGTQSRCFAHVADIARTLADLMTRDDVFGQVFNLGNDDEITIGELARNVRELTGGRSEIVHVPYDQAYGVGFEDMQRRVPGLAKIRALLGERPAIGLSRILADVVAHEKARVQ